MIKIGVNGQTKQEKKDDALRLIKKFRSRCEAGEPLVFCDGSGPIVRDGIRYGGVGCSIWLPSADGVTYQEHTSSWRSDNMTNIMAECLAVRDAIAIANELDAKYVLNDCQYVVELANGGWNPKPHLKPIVDDIWASIGNITVIWIDRQLNVLADVLSKNASANRENAQIV